MQSNEAFHLSLHSPNGGTSGNYPESIADVVIAKGNSACIELGTLGAILRVTSTSEALRVIVLARLQGTFTIVPIRMSLRQQIRNFFRMENRVRMCPSDSDCVEGQCQDW